MFVIYNIIVQEVSKIFKYILCNDINECNNYNRINTLYLSNVDYIFKDIAILNSII